MKLKLLVVLLVWGVALAGGLAWAQDAKVQALATAKKTKAKKATAKKTAANKFARKWAVLRKDAAILRRLRRSMRKLRRRARRRKARARKMLRRRETTLVYKYKIVRKRGLKRARGLVAWCKSPKRRVGACKRLAGALKKTFRDFKIVKINHPFENVVISH